MGAVLLLVVILLVLWQGGMPGLSDESWNLVIRDADQEQVLYRTSVVTDDVLVFHWVHSVEHFRWQETMVITKTGTLKLVESRFEGFGAGIPHENTGGVRVSDGWVILENIDREMPAYDWLHSHSALPEIMLNETVMLRGPDLPHHQPLRLTIEKR